MADSDPNDGDIFPAAYRAAQQEQAARLKPAAEKAGLKFEAYLTPGDAEWVLARVENSVFLSPSELVSIAVHQFIEMHDYPDLRRELLHRTLQKAMDDPSPGIPMEEAFAEIRADIEEFKKYEPARWEKVGAEHLPADPE